MMRSKLALSILLALTLGSAQGAGIKKVFSPKKKVKTYYPSTLLGGSYSNWGVDTKKGLAAINLLEGWKKFKKKKEVVVAVIDTGIEYNHPHLRDNIYVPAGKKSSLNYGRDFSVKNKKISFTPKDTHGHGTHVAGIIKTVFPDVKILALKYYNPSASGQQNLDSTIRALRYAINQNVDIINYSSGGPEASMKELRVLQEAEKKGILVIAAAGNERSNIDDKRNAYYPASYGLNNIVTVGAHNTKLKIISSSNYGKNSVDIAAPGFRIRSSIPTTAAGFMTGTSQATAFVSGVAAMIKSQYPKMDYENIKNIILSSSLPVKGFSNKILGGGKLDAGRAMELAESVNRKLKIKRKVANQ